MNKILLGFIAIGLFTLVSCNIFKNNTITDFEGNSYKTVKIGTQEWMAENLNVEHFINGDVIQEAKTDSEWQKAGKNEEPAWCYYDNNSSNGEKYGKLYNFYAVTDPRSLAPNGWHVPTDAEWTLLTDHLSANGHSGKEGIALKATSGWNSGGNGTDDYGFSGLPGGARYSFGNFDGIGDYGYWWSSSQYSTGYVWDRKVNHNSGTVYRGYSSKEDGFSVRCLRD